MGIFGKSKAKEIKIETVSDEEAIIKKLILETLNKKNTTIKVLSLDGRFIISSIYEDIAIHILVDGVTEVIKIKAIKDGVSINSYLDVKSKSSIHKLRGAFVDQIIKVVIAWIEKDRLAYEKSLFNEMSILEYVNELIDILPTKEEDTENKKSLK
jgi:hypothetical protein